MVGERSLEKGYIEDFDDDTYYQIPLVKQNHLSSHLEKFVRHC